MKSRLKRWTWTSGAGSNWGQHFTCLHRRQHDLWHQNTLSKGQGCKVQRKHQLTRFKIEAFDQGKSQCAQGVCDKGTGEFRARHPKMCHFGMLILVKGTWKTPNVRKTLGSFFCFLKAKDEFLCKRCPFYTQKESNILTMKDGWGRKAAIQTDLLLRNSLAVRGLELDTFTAGAWVQSSQETKICKPHGTASPGEKRVLSSSGLSQSWVTFPCWPPFAPANMKASKIFFFFFSTLGLHCRAWTFSGCGAG